MDNTAPNAANNAMPVGRKRFEWALWALLVGLVGVFLAFIHWAEVDRVNAVEQDRLGTLSKVIARRIGDNLAATNRTLAGVIADDLVARRPNGIPFNVSLR